MAAQLLPHEVAASVERFENCLTELSDSLEPVLRGLTPGRNAFSHVRASISPCWLDSLPIAEPCRMAAA
jgi:hypothetical protein